MQLEIGKVYNGKVKAITQYGAFMDIEGGGSGMVHISEIANTYVSDIREHLTEDQDVKVKVIGINEAGKVSLSIKKAAENSEASAPRRGDKGSGRDHRSDDKGDRGDKGDRAGNNNRRSSKPAVWEPKKQTPPSEMTFEDMMSRFKQTSEERICDLKRSTDRKNGTRRK